MNLRNKLKIFIVILISFLATWYTFRFVFPEINHKYFAKDGDGIKDYFCMLYHIKHDTSYLYSNVMNYPYGENIFYTGAQPFLTSVLKFLSSIFPQVKKYIIGIHNLSILLSLGLTVIIIFLIFQNLGLPYWYSLFSALGITFLSPQLDRIGGHFSLSYTIFIPLILLMLLKYHERKNILISIFIMIFFIIASFTHGYFFAFYSYIILGYWIFCFISDKRLSISLKLLNFTIQFVIPIFVFQFLTIIVDRIDDRTTWPWGFLFYKAYPESVFLSMNRPYWKWLDHIVNVRNVEWEGISYIGLVSFIVFVFVCMNFFKNLVKKDIDNILKITDIQLLNLFFWLSLFLLLFSFGIPFVFNLEFLLEYLGPIRQFRGIGRFAWLFFYVFNIISFYLIWNFFKNKKLKVVKFLFIFLILFYDAWFNSKSIQYFINNKLPVFDYAYNNNASSFMQVTNYQAIMPIPYFNTGSEAYWHDAACPTILKSYALSLYTGLPLNAVNMSRTSISQCVKNLQLIWEPYKDYPVLKDYDGNKYIMLYVDTTCDKISETEKLLLGQSEYVDTLWGFQIRKITIENIYQLIKFQKDKLSKIHSYNQSSYILFTYDSIPNEKSYLGKGSLKIEKGKNTALYREKLLSDKDSSYIISFWVYGMDKDMIPRNVVEVAIGDEQDKWYDVRYYAFKDIIKTFDNGWGLIEFEVNVKNPKDYLSIVVLKPPLGTPTYYIDNFMIRFGDNVIDYDKKHLVNNRLIDKFE